METESNIKYREAYNERLSTLSSPSERIDKARKDQIAKRGELLSLGMKNKYRINWEQNIIKTLNQEFTSKGVRVSFCSHVFTQESNTPRTVSLKVRFKLPDSRVKNVTFPLGLATDIESLKQGDYEKMLKETRKTIAKELYGDTKS